MNSALFSYIIFPGLIFTAVVGCIASWIDRKVSARVQWRVGPPLLQPFYDLAKLTGKETVLPANGAGSVFLLCPLIALVSITFVSTILWQVMLSTGTILTDNLIVLVYLLTIPSVALILSGAASANPLASLGASREMKLALSYELPFILAILVPVIKAGGSIKLGELLLWQWGNHPFLASPSGFIAFIVVILSIQAKLALTPFDASEAETEIVSGPFIDYSGTPLAIYKLGRWMLLFVLPMFVVVLFMGGIAFDSWHILWGILKYVLLLVIIILIRNTNPRVRIDQAVKFFWKLITPLAIAAVIMALVGF